MFNVRAPYATPRRNLTHVCVHITILRQTVTFVS